MPANEDDDSYSAAHDDGDIGTGVGDDEGVEAEDIPTDDGDEPSDKADDGVEVEPVKTP